MTSMRIKRVPMYCELLDRRIYLVIRERVVEEMGRREPVEVVEESRDCSEWKSCHEKGMDCKWARPGKSQVDPLRELK